MTELYTSYLANLKNIPEDVLKVFVFLYKPPKFEFSGSVFYCPQLAPSPELFRKFKSKELDLNQYLEEYRKLLLTRVDELEPFIKYLQQIKRVCLICYEKNADQCHRKVDAEFLQEFYGFKYRGEIHHA